MSDVNQPAVPPGGGEDWPEDGHFPDQMGGMRTLLMPGIDTFLLPAGLTTLWHDVVIDDPRPYLQNGQVNPTGPLGTRPDGTKGSQKVQRKQIKFDRNTPLVIVGGKHDGDVMTASYSTNPRARGKKDDPKTSWISDVAYILGVSLADKTYPKTPDATMATFNAYAGKTIRIEHGLTGQCRPDKIRYIAVATTEGTTTIADPTGKKGCGKRYYTSAFRNPETGAYDHEILCTCGQPSPEEAAVGAQPVAVVLRAFESTERFLPPLVDGTKAAV